MRTLRIAAIAAIIAGLFALAGADAWAHMGGAGHAGGGGHMGGGHMGGGHAGALHGAGAPAPGNVGQPVGQGGFQQRNPFLNHGHVAPGARVVPGAGVVHDGRFVRGVHGGQVHWWWVAGGVWYPWPQYAVAVPPATTVWYYCQSAGVYYPDVAECPEGWLLVVPAP